MRHMLDEALMLEILASAESDTRHRAGPALPGGVVSEVGVRDTVPRGSERPPREGAEFLVGYMLGGCLGELILDESWIPTCRCGPAGDEQAALPELDMSAASHALVPGSRVWIDSE